MRQKASKETCGFCLVPVGGGGQKGGHRNMRAAPVGGAASGAI